MVQKVLILGGKGMLGQALFDLFTHDPQYEVVAWDKEDVDVTQFEELREKIEAVAPTFILNCVAYNAVDPAEEDEAEYQKALLLNRDVPRELASITNDLKATLVHYSSDYVFDGEIEQEMKSGCGSSSCCGGNCHGGGEKGYGENAFPNPLSRYGESKALGEQEVMGRAKKYYLIRLSKLFGKPGVSEVAKKSFFDVMLGAGKTRDEVQAVDSETSCFTYAPDLAMATKDLLEDKAPCGIYHLTNTGAVTWYQAVVELYRQAGLTTKITPVTPDAFPRPAKRPEYSVLINTKRPPLRRYEVALAEYLSEENL